MKRRIRSIKRHTYFNLFFVAIGILVAIILSKYEPLQTFLFSLGDYGFIGAFFAGILFVSTFTAATSALLLLILAERLSPIELGLIAGLGADVGYLTILYIFKAGLFDEIHDLYNRFGGKHMSRI